MSKTQKITADAVWQEYQRGIDYNSQIDLYETVKKNENFYIGRQWEGLNAPDLEKPVLNFLGRTISYFIAMLVSDDVGIGIKSFINKGDNNNDSIIAQQVERVLERTKARSLHREALRNAAVDGDCCFFLRFDAQAETGQDAKGDIAIDLVDNTNIIFGNPYVAEVQKQPYIIIVKRTQLKKVQDEARRRGMKNWQEILPDGQSDIYGERQAAADDLVTELIKLWRDPSTGTVHYCKTTQNMVLQDDTDLGYKLYPIAYMNWQKVRNSYHGNPAITNGVIQNQIYVNTLWAMFMINAKRFSFPVILYDGGKVERWTNKVGQAIRTYGNPNEAVATAFRAPDFSVQAMELVEKTIAYTKEFMGTSDAALGNVRPDNASAIIAVQQATAAPLELQKMAFYQFVEDYVRIILDIMRVDYGVRYVEFVDDSESLCSCYVDFAALNYDVMELNIDIGTAAYWSELAQLQTADNLYAKGIIDDAVLYLESIPARYVHNKNKIIQSLNERKQQQVAMSGGQQNAAVPLALRNMMGQGVIK